MTSGALRQVAWLTVHCSAITGCCLAHCEAGLCECSQVELPANSKVEYKYVIMEEQVGVASFAIVCEQFVAATTMI